MATQKNTKTKLPIIPGLDAKQTNLRLTSKFASLFLIVDYNICDVAWFQNILKYLLHTFYGDAVNQVNMFDSGTAFRGLNEKAQVLTPLLKQYKTTVDKLY